jgi:hypothetical protein
MAAEIQLREMVQKEYDSWNRLVAASPSGSVYALPAYLDVLCSSTGGSFSILGVFRGSELVGGMPIYSEGSRGGRMVYNRLLLYYLSPVIREYSGQYPYERTSKHLAILRPIEEYLRTLECSYLHVNFRHPIADVRTFLSDAWHVQPSYTYMVNIKDLEETWRRIEQNMRRLITRAQKQGLVFTDDDDFDSFFRLHAEIHERKGGPLYLPEASFRSYYERLMALSLARLFHARLPDGRSVASQLVLTGPKPVAHTVCAGASGEHMQSGSTPFLRWKSFECLSGLGYSWNDLTDARLNDVTRFKGQLGGDLMVNWAIMKRPSIRYRIFQKIDFLKTVHQRLKRRI